MLVLRPGALGDTLLAVPALRALRPVYRPVTLAAHGPTARLLAGVDEVDAGLAFDDRSLEWVFRDEPAPEPTVAWMANPVRGALVSAPSRPSAEQHVAEYLVDTLTHLGIPPEVDNRRLRIAPLTSGEVLVHPGSGSPSKNWPAACFAAVIRRLDNVRLIVGEADAHAAQEVEAHLGRTVPRLHHVPLAELARHLAGCRAYIGNDSGVSHLAGLCGARTLVLFGPTSPKMWQPLGPAVRVLPFDASADEVASAAAAA